MPEAETLELLHTSNFKAVAFAAYVGTSNSSYAPTICRRVALDESLALLPAYPRCSDRHAPCPFQSKHETPRRFPWRARLQSAHSQSTFEELQAAKLARALPVGAHGGARPGLHPFCRLSGSWHIRRFRQQSRPAFQERDCVDSLPIGLLTTKIYAGPTLGRKMHARDARKA